MNKQKQIKLASFFEQLAQGQIVINNIKEKLLKCVCFSPSSIFQRISQGSPHITIEMMQNYTRVPFGCTDKQIYELFCRFDWSRSGKISKQDFLRELRPYKSKRLKTQGDYKLSAQVQSVFFQLINEYIERWRIYEVCRQELSDVIPYQAFDSVAVYRKGFIGGDQLQLFCLKNDVELNKKSTEMLMFALKRRCYTNINLQVFCENLWPLEFGYYPAFEQELKHIRHSSIRALNDQDQDIVRKSRKLQVGLMKDQMRHERRVQARLSESFQNDSESFKLLESRLYPKSILKQSTKSSILSSEPLIKYAPVERYIPPAVRTRDFSQIQNSRRQQNLQTPYFDGRKSTKSTNPYLLEASRKDVQRERATILQQEIKLRIQEQKALRKAKIQLQSSASGKDKFNGIRPRTQMLQSKFKAQRDLMNRTQINLQAPRDSHFSLSTFKPYQHSTPEHSQFNPIPVTQKHTIIQSIYQPHPSYTFGAQHLRVYRRPQKENKHKPYAKKL